MDARWEGAEVALSQLVPAATAIEIQASSALPGPEGWQPVARFPAGAARIESVRVPSVATARYFRAVAVE